MNGSIIRKNKIDIMRAAAGEENKAKRNEKEKEDLNFHINQQ